MPLEPLPHGAELERLLEVEPAREGAETMLARTAANYRAMTAGSAFPLKVLAKSKDLR